MKHIISIPLIFTLLFSSVLSVYSQEKQLVKAHKSYEHYNYVDAQKIYLKVAERGFESEELFSKLGNSFYFNAQYDEAVKWYEKLFELNDNPEAVYFRRYAQALKATGDDKKAKTYYDRFVAMTSTDPDAKIAIDYLALLRENSDRYDLEAVRALYDDKKISYGSAVIDEKLVYASTEKERKSFVNTRDAWDGLTFLSLYEVPLTPSGQANGKPVPLKELQGRYHESSPVFTADGNTVYFTRSNFTSQSKNSDQNLKIYRAVRMEDETWGEPEELSINSDSYSTAHPALSPDEKTLYFASDRPGGFGETDLYAAPIHADGSLGNPKNLGDKINTKGKETFPFISKENELYFSSDGHFGLGGLDVFYIEIKDDGSFGNLLNVGEPVNSYADDFAFGIDTETKRGFVSSNRAGSKGKFVYDNIYTFEETVPIIDVYKAEIEGVILDKHTGEPIAGATVVLTDPEGNVHARVITDEDGRYRAETNKFVPYTIRVEEEHYDIDEKISEPNLAKQTIDFDLQKNKEEMLSGTDLAKVLNIPIIYFDFDKADIRPDAQVELEKVLAMLETYPQLRLNIRSHTDSRGSDAYNLRLSERRARSTRDYLIGKNTDPDRLTAEGLGETELVNHCSNGVDCSEAEHQKNRRSEFIVLD